MVSIDISTASSKELVAFYNANSETPIKRFESRAKGERRVAALIEALSAKAKESEGAINASEAEPVLAWKWPKAADFPVVDHAPESEKKPGTALVVVAKGPVSDEVDEATGDAENETDDEADDETPEAEAARLEAEAKADNSSPEAKAEKAEKRAKTRSSNSERVALSWRDPVVRAKRLTKDGVWVSVDDEEAEWFKSVYAAYVYYDIPAGSHITFRGKVKKSRDETLEYNGSKYRFRMDSN